MKRPVVHISDHALVRYLERVGGFDIETLRGQLQRRMEQAASAQASALKVDGFVYCLAYREGKPTLTTVLEDEDQHPCHIPLSKLG